MPTNSNQLSFIHNRHQEIYYNPLSIEVLYFQNLMNVCKEIYFGHFYFQSNYHTAEDNLALFADIRSELLALSGIKIIT